MVITLGPELEKTLNDLAQQEGVSPEVLALEALRERSLPRRGMSGCSGSVGPELRRGFVRRRGEQ